MVYGMVIGMAWYMVRFMDCRVLLSPGLGQLRRCGGESEEQDRGVGQAVRLGWQLSTHDALRRGPSRDGVSAGTWRQINDQNGIARKFAGPTAQRPRFSVSTKD